MLSEDMARRVKDWELIIADFEKYQHENELREYWIEGIPSKIRGKVWI